MILPMLGKTRFSWSWFPSWVTFGNWTNMQLFCHKSINSLFLWGKEGIYETHLLLIFFFFLTLVSKIQELLADDFFSMNNWWNTGFSINWFLKCPFFFFLIDCITIWYFTWNRKNLGGFFICQNTISLAIDFFFFLRMFFFSFWNWLYKYMIVSMKTDKNSSKWLPNYRIFWTLFLMYGTFFVIFKMFVILWLVFMFYVF